MATFNCENTARNPLISTDTIYKNGIATSQTTFHNCITALKEYENKSLEELRYEDYILNRRFPRRSPPPLPVVAAQKNGSYLIKYKRSPGADIKTFENRSYIYFDTTYMSITAMPEYESKSFEEIRYEDYLNGHKVPLVMSKNLNQTKTVEPIFIKDKNEMKQNEEALIDSMCPICLESITNLKKQNIRLMVTTCGHIICKVCTNNLLKSLSFKKQPFNQAPMIDCPNCRKKLSQASIHDLYL